jgi:isopenicillin N synthase-like dioxygenase
MVAQVGQQLEILTGGTLVATPHVIAAPGVPNYSRLSSAHFVHVRTDVILPTLPWLKLFCCCLRSHYPSTLEHRQVMMEPLHS